jgi:hypothetical protein
LRAGVDCRYSEKPTVTKQLFEIGLAWRSLRLLRDFAGLLNHIKSMLASGATDAAAAAVLAKLRAAGHVRIDDKAGLSYHL